jgi:uncharacterized protein YbjT (DUF2867 family)
MFVILGASGHIGAELVRVLLELNQEVLAVTHDPEKVHRFVRDGAQAVAVDLHEPKSLRSVLQQGTRAFLLNPPAPTSSDTDKEELKTVGAILEALRGSSLQKGVLASTYGAQHGDAIGDLSVLFDFEQALRNQPIPVSVLRSAYYMSNWDAMLGGAKDGILRSMFPAEFRLPMVAPGDVASAAAELLLSPPEPFEFHHIEGPSAYTPTDVAQAFSASLGREVHIDVVPRDRWKQTYREMGFSPEAARAYAKMTATTIDQGPEHPDAPLRGHITLRRYISDLVARSE